MDHIFIIFFFLIIKINKQYILYILMDFILIIILKFINMVMQFL